ncbi:MAG: phage major tail tube protein [Clostridia bacterium]|nr:phage major tail tube protein [Clostridia bacterium]
MPQKVYNNVVGQKLIDNGRTVEDITSVSLPTVEFPTSTISSNGMAADVDVPNMAHVSAMEFGVSHNNGHNCQYLNDPGKHSFELRVARQKYNVAVGDMDFESMKVRVIGLLKNDEKGAIETNNPYTGTNKYSVLRYEEEIDGKVITLIDAMTGQIVVNGKSMTDKVESLLN